MNVQAQGLGKISQLWALKCGTCLIFPENCCNRRSKRIEAVRSHRCMAAGVQMNEFEMLRSHNTDNGAIMCLFDRTEDRINN